MSAKPTLTTKTISSVEEMRLLEESWEQLYRRAGQSVFQSYEWISTWWEVVGTKYDRRVFSCWSGDRLVGLLPYFIQSFPLAIRTVRRLRMAGEYAVYGEYAPLIEWEFQETFVAEAGAYLARLISSGQVDFVDFTAFRSGSPLMVGLAEDLSARGLFVEHNPTYAPRTSFELPPSWDDYLSSLKGRQRRELKRDMRVLERSGARYEAVCEPDPGMGMVEDLIVLHTALWKRRGAGGHFVTDKHFEEFLRSVTLRLLRKREATVYALRRDGQPLVMLLNFHSHRIYYSYIAGRNLDHELASSSPGVVLFSRSIGDAIESGYREFDFLGGDQPYKLALGGILSYYGRILARRRGPAGFAAWLMVVLLELRTLIHIKFYRHKVLPKFNKTFRNRTSD